MTALKILEITLKYMLDYPFINYFIQNKTHYWTSWNRPPLKLASTTDSTKSLIHHGVDIPTQHPPVRGHYSKNRLH